MVHQPSGGARGQATDIQIQAEEIIKLKKQLNEIYVKHTKQPLDFIYENMERDKVSHTYYSLLSPYIMIICHGIQLS